MATSNTENLQNELKAKRICRFCLTQQSEKLGNIYARDARSKTAAPLHVQIMAIASMEVFSNDGMPSWVCTDCRLLFDHSYRFKQMCKRAETLLRQYPLTGEWPAPMVKPTIPQGLIPKQAPLKLMPSKQPQLQQQQQHPTQVSEGLAQQQPYTIHIITPPAQAKPSGTSTQREQAVPASVSVLKSAAPKKKILNSSPAAAPEPPVPVRMKREWIDNEATNFLNKVENNEELSMDDVQRLIAAADEEEFVMSEPITLPPSKSTKKPKVLNKSSIRILNKEADVIPEPRLSQPQVKKDEDGNVSIVTEILDPSASYETEPDPIKNAEPVETNVFPCPHCERSFPLLQLRDIHMVNHNRERLFQCGECDRSFFSKYDLQKHNQTHTGAKPYKCTVCSKAFTRATLRYRHEKTHTDIPKFICIYCEKPFLSKEEMEKHTERHRKNRPFQCKVCSKAFAFKQGLERHEVVHLRDQPYPCQYCDQSFSTPSKLARHLTAHAGKRPYPCKFCSKSYLLSHHLTRHLRSHKQCKAVFLCSDCGKVYATRDELIFHSAVHATATLICPLCQARFADVDGVTAHIKQHADGDAYACEFCDLIFITSEQLQEHIDIMHADDMAAYHEDDKAQEKQRQIAISKIEVGDEVEMEQNIEEFILDDLPESLKELRTEVVVDNEATAGTTVKEQRSGTNKAAQVKVLSEVVISRQSYTALDDDIEILDSSMLDDEIDPELAGDESEFLEEPTKKRKVVSGVQKQPSIVPMLEKAKTVTQPPRRKVAEAPKVQGVQKQQAKAEKQIESTQKPKQTSAAIVSMLNALPKGVSVRRNASSAAMKPAVDGEASSSSKPTTSKASQQQVYRGKLSPNHTVTRAASKRSSGGGSEERTKTLPTNKQTAIKQSPSPSKPAAIATTSPGPSDKVVKMMLGDKKVKVQKITVTKAEAEAMAKQGRISFKDGNMILTQFAPKSSK